MDRENIKKIYLETTLNLPTFNTDDKYFEYFVYDILEDGERWETINDCFKNSNIDFIGERNKLLNELICDFNKRETYERVANMKKTYPRFFNNKETVKNQGKTIIHTDLSKASYQVVKYVGAYDEETWKDYLSTKTKNGFILEYDQTIMRQVLNNGYYKNVTYSCPVFDGAFTELLWVAYNSGLNDLLVSFGFKKTRVLKDSFNYVLVDPLKINDFKKMWPEKELKRFNGLDMHYDMYEEHYIDFYIPEKNKTISVKTEKHGDNIEVKKKLFDEHYPQFKKLANGKTVTEKDLWFSSNNKKSEKITLIK